MDHHYLRWHDRHLQRPQTGHVTGGHHRISHIPGRVRSGHSLDRVHCHSATSSVRHLSPVLSVQMQ